MHEHTISTGNKIHLRTAGYEDMPAVAELAGKAFWNTFTGLMPEKDLQNYIAGAFSAGQFRREWRDAGCIFILAFSDDVLAGYAKINTNRRKERPEADKYIELERLYLLKEFQGKKIGATLMQYCIRYARENGFNALWLNVWEQNIHALKFYQRRNFKIMDTSVMMRGNDPQKALWMKKELNHRP